MVRSIRRGEEGERDERERERAHGGRACVAQQLRNLVGVGEKKKVDGWVGVYRLISDMCMRAPGRREGRRGGIGRQVNGLRGRERAGSITG